MKQGDSEWRMPGDFDFVGEIGEDFGVTAELQIERLFYGNWAAAVAALVPDEHIGIFESTIEKSWWTRTHTQLKPP